MEDPPDDPRAFVEEFLPRRFQALEGVPADMTSVGSVVFRVEGAGEWSLRLLDGRLEIVRGVEDDVLLQVTVTGEDFPALVAEGLRGLASRGGVAGRTGLGVLSLDPRTARGLRHMPGSVLLSVADGDASRRVLLTPGLGRADMSAPDCTVACSRADYEAIQSGAESPMQLFANGRLRLTGNVQLALALAGVFA